MSVGYVPEAWKNAIITPVYKHGPAEMPRCTASIHSNFFAERVINIWNSLPVTVNFSTLKSFRRTIQSVDFFIVFKV